MKSSLLCGALVLTVLSPGSGHAQAASSALTLDKGGAGSASLLTNCNASTQSIGGGGDCTGFSPTIIDNGITRNMGTSPFLTGDQWHTTHGLEMRMIPKGSGISEAVTLYYNGFKYAGDTTVLRIFDNFHPGGGVDGSGERHKGLYLYETVLADAIGTVNTTAFGTSRLDWTQTNGCGAQGSSPTSNCTGGGGILIRQSAPLYTTTVSASTEPSYKAYGTMKVATTLTPSLIVPIPGGIPDITGTNNFAAGQSISVTIAAPALAGAAMPISSIPASGTVCVTGPGEVQPEELNYTLTGTTMTLAGHRFPHGPTAVAFLCGKGTFLEAPIDTQYNTSHVRSLVMVLGNVDAHTLAYTSSYGGGRNFIHTGATFRAGTAGRDTIVVYDGAFVLGGNGAPSATAMTGPMPLETNHAAWTRGDTVEEGVHPGQEHTLVHKGCSAGLPATGSENVCDETDVNDAFINIVDKVVLNVPVSMTTFGGGLIPPVGSIRKVTGTANDPGNANNNGIYYNLDTLYASPINAITDVRGCVGGDTTPNCANSPEYMLWRQYNSALGGQATKFNPRSGMFRFDLAFPVFQNGLYSRGHGLYFVAPNDTAAKLPTVTGNIDTEAPGVIDVGNGKPNNTSGQIKTTFFTPTSAPDATCAQALGGTPRYIHHGPGTADSYQICLMGADNVWAWRTPSFSNFP